MTRRAEYPSNEKRVLRVRRSATFNDRLDNGDHIDRNLWFPTDSKTTLALEQTVANQIRIAQAAT